MDIKVRRAEYKEIEPLRELYRQEANCQIMCDSILRRGMADPYLIQVDGRIGGYAGIWNKFDPGRVMEFYTLPSLRAEAAPMFRELIRESRATHLEAQTNLPLMLLMLHDFGRNVRAENVLFDDGFTSQLTCPNATFRKIEPEDASRTINGEKVEAGNWMLEVEGEIVGTGGIATHYNPPYGDLYMGIAEPHRRKGYGSYLIQELKRVCYETGRKPAARCNFTNIASRRTLQKAGMLPYGHLITAEIAESTNGHE
jgi:RimJ/RimL family protein N-acetyltransferase